MIDDVIAGTLANAISIFGQWIITASLSRTSRQNARKLDIAMWLDTYSLSKHVPENISLPAGLALSELETEIQSNEVQAILLELLCIRITAAPDADVAKVRIALESAFTSRFPSYEMSQITEPLFNYYDEEICDLVGALSGAMPDTFDKLREDAFSARIVAVLNSIEQHVSSLSGRMSYLEETAYLENYNRHVREYHGKIQPPDSERRQRVPIDKLYVTPTIAPYDINQIPHGPDDETDSDVEEASPETSTLTLPEFRERLDRTVLLGNPGGGKSTASNVLMYQYSSEANPRIPFLVVLRDFAPTMNSLSVLAYIESKLESLYQCKPPIDLIRRLLLSGRAVVIFDGLDELTDTARRLEVTDVVEQFCIEYPLASVLVTSRIVGYSVARLDPEQFTCFRLAGFNAEQTAEYVKKWFTQDESIGQEDVERWVNSFLEESANVPDLTSNPLMLALMCILYHGEGSIPRNRPEVYERCAELLFRKWDARRRINVELRASSLIEPAIRHLAYFLFTRDGGQSAVTERVLVRETTSFLQSRGFEPLEEATDASQQFVEFCRGRAWVFTDAGTTATGERLYTFTHRTFLEYFTAAYLAISSDTPDQLARQLLPHIAKQEWDVVTELAIRKKDEISDRGGERTLIAILNDKRRRSPSSRGNILSFLARYASSVEVPGRVLRDIAATAVSFFLDNDVDGRDYSGPLACALIWPGEKREIAREEIQRRGTELLASEDEVTHLLGLKLLVYIDAITPRIGEVGGARDREAISDYWSLVAKENSHIYSTEIANASKKSNSMLRLALALQIITVGDYLGERHGQAATLFYRIPLEIFGVSWGGYLPMCLSALIQEERPPNKFTGHGLAGLRDLGEYFQDARPSLPWVQPPAMEQLDPTMQRLGFEMQRPPRVRNVSSQSLSESELLGAVVTLCTAFEMVSLFRDFTSPIPKEIPAWPEMEAYLRKRDETQEGVVVLRNIFSSEENQKLLTDWAEHRINFVTRETVQD
jgi:NACHT domain